MNVFPYGFRLSLLQRRFLQNLHAHAGKCSFAPLSKCFKAPISSCALPVNQSEEFDPQNLLAWDCVKKKIPYKHAEQLQHFISTLHEDDKSMLKLFKLEHDMRVARGEKTPAELTDEMLVYMLAKCPTLASRKRISLYWFKREKHLTKKSHVCLTNKSEPQSESNIDKEKEIKSFILQKVRKKTMRKHYFNNLCYAMIHGPTIVFDCEFEDFMREKEILNLGKQLVCCHHLNMPCRDPFHFHFSNLSEKSLTLKSIRQHYAELPDSPITMTNDCFMNHYPKESLVYLSPNADENLSDVSPDMVYIIGGIVDMSDRRPLTLDKARRLGIKAAKLPLDEHVKWIRGVKSLTLDQVFGILCEQKQTGNWLSAFMKYLPSRKYIVCEHAQTSEVPFSK